VTNSVPAKPYMGIASSHPLKITRACTAVIGSSSAGEELIVKATMKAVLKRTPLYAIYREVQRWNERRNFWKWTDDDDKRATFYRQFIRPGDLVFDIGANLGNRTKVFHQLGARVVAFEPQRKCFEFLKSMFHGISTVQIVRHALGRSPSTGELCCGQNHTIASLSQNWIAAVKDSRRFGTHEWASRESIEITTLDCVIADMGPPRFIKIDVEGYEFEVLSGLSTPIDCLSVEFTPEYIENTHKCLDHMASLSAIEANLSLGESSQLGDLWLSAQEMKNLLNCQDRAAWGDVYIRRINDNRR